MLDGAKHFRVGCLTTPRKIEKDSTRGAAQALEVPREEKRLLVVRAERLIDAVAEQKAVIEYRDAALGDGGDVAVDIDQSCDRCRLLHA